MALPCVIPRVLSYYLLPLGWIMKKVMTIFVQRRPSWTPSWIFQNAQGWPKSTRRILKIDHLGYPKPSREKLTLTFPGSAKICHLAPGLCRCSVHSLLFLRILNY